MAAVAAGAGRAAVALAASGLEVSLGGRPVLLGVDVEVPAGQLLAVVGANGAGKSTLLKALAGLVPRTAGEVRVAGQPLERHGRRGLARILGYVPQADGGSLPFAVRSFVEMGRYPHLGRWGGLSATDAAAVEWALEVTGTTPFASRTVDTLSGGERQRVMVAAALAQGGSTLLLDEPTAFLDYRHQVQVLDLLERLHAESGLTVVVVTHDLNAGLPSCQAVLALREGRVCFHGPPSRLLDPSTLAEVYGTGFALADRPGQGLPLVVPSRGRG